MSRSLPCRMPFLRAVFCAAIILCLGAVRTHGQSGTGSPVNVNSCYSDLLRNQFDFSQHTSIKYRLFSLWSKDLYEQSKMDSSLFTAYGAGGLDGSQTRVLREMQMNNESVDYDRATAIHAALLDPAAAQIINHCLDTLTSGTGVHTKLVIEDERYLDLTIYWNSNAGTPLKFKSQEIFNGIVLDDKGSHRPCPWSLQKPDCFRAGVTSRSLQDHREPFELKEPAHISGSYSSL